MFEIYSQLFQMQHSLKYIGVDVLDPVAVKVKVLEAAEAMESTRAQRLQIVVIQQERTTAVQVGKHPRCYLVDLVETKIPNNKENYINHRQKLKFLTWGLPPYSELRFLKTFALSLLLLWCALIFDTDRSDRTNGQNIVNRSTTVGMEVWFTSL